MIFRSQIFLASAVIASGTTPGPSSIAEESDYLFTTKKTTQDTALKISTDVVGGYGCFRSGMKYVAPQVLNVETDQTNENQIVIASGDHSTFYGVDNTDAGTVAELGAGAGKNFPNGNQTTFETWASSQPTNAWTQCCAGTAESAEANTDVEVLCTSLISMQSVNAGTYSSGGDAISYGAVGRIQVGPGAYTDIGGSGVATLDVNTVNNDFILGALGQLSDNASGDTNFCSSVYGPQTSGANFLDTSSSTATLEAKENMTGVTKCTWQVIGKEDLLVKIQVTGADNALFYLQWVEFSNNGSNDPASLVSATEMTNWADGSADFDISDTAGDAPVFWINPFITGAPQDASGADYQTASDILDIDDWYIPSDEADDYYIPGSVGRISIFSNHAAGIDTDQIEWGADDATAAWIDASVVLSVYAKAAAEFETAAGLNDDYDDEESKYNTAVKDYNAALEETPDEANLDDIPERPCPPTAPGDFYGIQLKGASTDDFGASGYFDGTSGPVATRININPGANGGSPTAWDDSHRLGYSFVYPDDTSGSEAYSANFSGHVFGILGSEYDSTVTKGHRWQAAATPTNYLNYLQVSVFPIDSDYALASGESVTIAASVVALDDFAAPEAASAPSASLEDITGASALVASTVALGALAATLF